MPGAPVEHTKRNDPTVEPFAFGPAAQSLAVLWSVPFRTMMVVMSEATKPYHR
ncbi:MAG: hypothetical protein AAF416_02620 [Pseudomonadota bacterium]